MASISYLHVLDMREAFHCIVVNPLPTLSYCILQEAPFSSLWEHYNKGLQKLFVYILQPYDPSPGGAECAVVARY